MVLHDCNVTNSQQKKARKQRAFGDSGVPREATEWYTPFGSSLVAGYIDACKAVLVGGWAEISYQLPGACSLACVYTEQLACMLLAGHKARQEEA